MMKGKKEFEKWKTGKPLTRRETMEAQCYECNGQNEGGVDCQGEESCPMYQYMPYGSGIGNPNKNKSKGNIEALKNYQSHIKSRPTPIPLS